MRYYELVRLYNEVRAKSGRLDKVEIISNFIKKLNGEELREVIYILQGRVFADNDARKTGVNEKIVIKALSVISGENEKEIEKIWSRKGDLGEISEVWDGGDLKELLRTSTYFEDIDSVMENRSSRLALWKSTWFHEAYIKEHTKPTYVKAKRTEKGDTNGKRTKN